MGHIFIVIFAYTIVFALSLLYVIALFAGILGLRDSLRKGEWMDVVACVLYLVGFIAGFVWFVRL